MKRPTLMVRAPRLTLIAFWVLSSWLPRPISASENPPQERDNVALSETDAAFESYRAHIAAAQASLRLGDYGEARRWLNGAPAPHRGWEWAHINARLEESREAFACNVGPQFALDVSPDGRLLATGGDDGIVRLWDAATGKPRGELPGHTDQIFSVRFSPDGAKLVSASKDKSARVWDIEKKDALITFEKHDVAVTSAAFTPDGSLIASCNYERLAAEPNPRIEGRVYIWNARTGADDETLAKLTGGVKPLSSLRFTPDGNHLVCGSWGGSVFAWDLTQDKPEPVELTLPDEGRYNAVDAIDVSPDGSLIACASKDRTARVWNRASRELIATLRGHGGYVSAVAFAPKQPMLATAGHDDLIMLWDTKDWRLQARLAGHAGAVRALSFSPRGDRLYSTGVDGTIRVWDPSYTGYGATVRMKQDAACYAVYFTPDGNHLFSCGYDGWGHQWETDTGKRQAFWEAHPGASCNAMDLSRDGRRFATCSWDKTVRVWDATTREKLRQFQANEGVYNVAISPDSQFVAATMGNVIAVWDVGSGRMVRRLTGHEAAVTEVRFSGSGSLLASASADKTARVWHVATGLLLATMRGHEGKVQSVAFDPTGAYLATGGDDGRVKLWGARDGAMIRALYASDHPVYRVRFSPVGERVAIASHELVLIDPQRGAAVAKFQPHNDTIWNLQFSPDGTKLASCSWDGTIIVLDKRSLRSRLGLPIQVENDRKD